MKKLLAFILVMVLCLGTFAGCGGSGDADKADGDMVTVTVGASAAPHGEILAALKDSLAEEGVDLQVKEYTDYIIPNTAVESGEIDANYFQHEPYMIDFNEKNDTHLVSAAAIHYEPMGVYPGKSSDLKAIPDKAVIVIPNDPTNEARALQLLAAEGIITLPADSGLDVTPKDIVENPHNIEFLEMEAAAVARSLADADFGIINGNYALEAGLKADQGLVFEASDSEGAKTYANIFAVKEGRENEEAIQKVIAALTSDECREFIESTYDGMVLPVF